MSGQEIVSPFVTSSYSGGGSANECVEVAHTVNGGRAVRDSKDRAAGTQFHGPAEWAAFVAALKNGHLGG
ncbi:DUF397 domain-containing protein [Streptomyces platensis]|uniref:DUF397 domain-containing protein n=1 Tax=Streptomyces platensis TaxID=58346 RepID=UPI002E816C86|nr:DUF397 domain-containing protein [Streptomyces platensis]WTI52886.1 DUF397 domain-containing protein [Streptomyces platensis]WUB81502.1 DUF397 domain-containing protein [Streptomyces platensis]